MKPFWIRRLCNNLLRCEPVMRVMAHTTHIQVWYTTGFKRVYTYKPMRRRMLYTRPITKEMAKCDWPIPIGQQVQLDPTIPAKDQLISKYIQVPRSRIDTLSYIEREVLIQHIMTLILNNGYIQPYISEADITREATRHLTAHSYMYKDAYDLYAIYEKPRVLMSIYEKYYDMSSMHRGDPSRTLKIAFTNKAVLFVALQHLVNESKADLNITGLFNSLYKLKYGPKWANPIFTWSVLKDHLNIDHNTILVDASPNLHEKAFSALYLNCKYATIDNTRPPQELVDRVGIHIVDAQKPYDLVVYDNAMKPVDISTFDELRRNSTRLVVFVPHANTKTFLAHDRPNKIVKIKTSPMRSIDSINYFFIYTQGPQK